MKAWHLGILEDEQSLWRFQGVDIVAETASTTPELGYHLIPFHRRSSEKIEEVMHHQLLGNKEKVITVAELSYSSSFLGARLWLGLLGATAEAAAELGGSSVLSSCLTSSTLMGGFISTAKKIVLLEVCKREHQHCMQMRVAK